MQWTFLRPVVKTNKITVIKITAIKYINLTVLNLLNWPIENDNATAKPFPYYYSAKLYPATQMKL